MNLVLFEKRCLAKKSETSLFVKVVKSSKEANLFFHCIFAKLCKKRCCQWLEKPCFESQQISLAYKKHSKCLSVQKGERSAKILSHSHFLADQKFARKPTKSDRDYSSFDLSSIICTETHSPIIDNRIKLHVVLIISMEIDNITHIVTILTYLVLLVTPCFVR
jgi:hypothetical protein